MPVMIRLPLLTEARHVTPPHPAIALLPEAPTRAEIEAFGRYLQGLESSQPAPDIGTRHHFAGEVYGRSVVIQADTFLVGLPHREDHLCVCVGDITVWTEHGRQRLTGAHILEAKAGAPRVGFAHADTTWLTISRNPTGGRNVQAIEDALVEHSELLLSRRHQPREIAR